MKIIPAIDLKDGKCVRLFKGEFDKTTEYSSDPASVGRRFSALDVEDIHIVDLDGARTGRQENRRIVAEIASQSGLAVQLGGGIRDRDDVASWLGAGITRCVIGSVAIRSPDQVKQWLVEFGSESIVLALDINFDSVGTPMLTTDGWTKESGVSLWECIDRYSGVGVKHVLCTDVARDGAMTGPSFDLYIDILTRYPDLLLQASGGVRHIDDLNQLRGMGVPAAITGRALLDGEISAREIASFRRNG